MQGSAVGVAGVAMVEDGTEEKARKGMGAQRERNRKSEQELRERVRGDDGVQERRRVRAWAAWQGGGGEQSGQAQEERLWHV
jgi:hypothetical protein